MSQSLIHNVCGKLRNKSCNSSIPGLSPIPHKVCEETQRHRVWTSLTALSQIFVLYTLIYAAQRSTEQASFTDASKSAGHCNLFLTTKRQSSDSLFMMEGVLSCQHGQLYSSHLKCYICRAPSEGAGVWYRIHPVEPEKEPRTGLLLCSQVGMRQFQDQQGSAALAGQYHAAEVALQPFGGS